ncbi:MAG: DUF4214 domain-containing protein [Alphaproteobacteria bacterium]
MTENELVPPGLLGLTLLPAPAQTVIAFPHTGDYRKDALIESLSYRWNAESPVGTPVTVTFSFAAARPTYVRAADISGFETFSTYERDLAREILRKISSFSNINFTEVPDSAASFGQIRFSKSQQDDSSGFAFLPFSNGRSIDGDVFIDTGSVTSRTTREEDYALFAHEIFHALGLKHSGNYDALEGQSDAAIGNFLGRAEDSVAYTTMSYRGVTQGQQSLGGIYDILTLQYLYGERLSETGNNVYSLSDFQGTYLETLTDGGGIDRLDLSALSVGARIDLREGSFSSIGLSSLRAAASNNFAIAFGAEIENVTGSNSTDSLIGNSLDNSFAGLGGNDLIEGLDGIDSVSYENDPAGVQINLETGTGLDGFGGTDSLRGIEIVTGSKFADILRGDGGRNTLRGMAGDDALDGGGQPDFGDIPLFIGDAADYSSMGAISVVVNLSLGRAEDGLGGIYSLAGIEDVLGSDVSDTLTGDNGRNGFRGFAGNDTIDGLGNDPQQGDFVSYFLDPASVNVDLTTGIGLDGYGGIDTLRGIENLNSSRFSDTLRGDDGRNIFQGLNGDDTLSGESGTDVSIYQGARNTYIIAVNADARTISDTIAGRDGVDILRGMERLQFSDGVLAFDNLLTDTAGRGYLLYRAAFDRTPDVEGLGYWVGELDRGQDFGTVVAASFIASAEFTSKYGSNFSNAAFVDLVYQNVLDRAPDTAGGDYWLGQLDSGLARSSMLASFAISDENYNSVRPLLNDGIFFV